MDQSMTIHLFEMFARLVQKHPYSWIEPKIKPLVDTMNQGEVIQTVASCQGHYSLAYSRRPYVYFRAPIDLASVISKRLFEMSIRRELNYSWALTGHFADGVLHFCLESETYTRAADTFFLSAWLYIVKRKTLDANLEMLTNDISKTISTYISNNKKPEISNLGNTVT